MPDPALLALVQHSASPPPAIVEQFALADAEPFLSAYEAIAADQDRALNEWIAGEAEMRRATQHALESRPDDFGPEMFDEIIGPFRAHMRRQKRITARLERRNVSHASPRLKRLRERVLARQRQQYAAGADLVRFLQAMRERIVERQSTGALPGASRPNAATVDAMMEARAGDLPRFASVADLMADLHADD